MCRIVDMDNFRIPKMYAYAKIKGEKVWVGLKVSNDLKKVPNEILEFFINKSKKNPDEKIEKLIKMLQRHYRRYSINYEEQTKTTNICHLPIPMRHIYLVITKKERPGRV